MCDDYAELNIKNVLKYVPHRQWVFSIPKRLRIYFMFDRKLLSKLSQCVWKVLSVYLKHAVSDEDADPGAVIAIQSFGLRLVDLRLGERLSWISSTCTRADNRWLLLR